MFTRSFLTLTLMIAASSALAKEVVEIKPGQTYILCRNNVDDLNELIRRVTLIDDTVLDRSGGPIERTIVIDAPYRVLSVSQAMTSVMRGTATSKEYCALIEKL